MGFDKKHRCKASFCFITKAKFSTLITLLLLSC